MSKLAQGVGTGIVMEVARGERNVAFVGLDGATVSVRRMEKREFDLAYSGEPADGTRARSPYAPTLRPRLAQGSLLGKNG